MKRHREAKTDERNEERVRDSSCTDQETPLEPEQFVAVATARWFEACDTPEKSLLKRCDDPNSRETREKADI